MDCNKENNFILKLLLIFLFIGLLGAAKPVLFNGGSSPAKYLAKKESLKMIQEKDIERFMESELFGDSDLNMDSSLPFYSSDEIDRTINNIYKYDSIIAFFIATIPLLFFLPKALNNRYLHHLLILVFLWLFCQSLGAVLNEGKKYSEYAIFAHATRWGLPLVLWLGFCLRVRGKDISSNKSFINCMIICTSLTFLVHGWEAYNLNPPFQDLLYSTSSIFGFSLSESINFTILKIVGIMDLTLVFVILFYRNSKIFLWMAFWGLITALSRPLTIGFEAWPEFAMRIANCALPLGLFLFFKNQHQNHLEPELNTKKMEIICE
ncbi:MAG: hypothetical protein NE334_03885 [Lentisphaeraceae bacterium]|nr:hypothetical protein [Lentisphaeraceae bacterium]